MQTFMKWCGIVLVAALLTFVGFVGLSNVSHLKSAMYFHINPKRSFPPSFIVKTQFQKKVFSQDKGLDRSSLKLTYKPLPEPPKLPMVCHLPAYVSPTPENFSGNPKIAKLEFINQSIGEIHIYRIMERCQKNLPVTYRLSPSLPQGISRDAYCELTYQKDERGNIINVKIHFCTNKLLFEPTLEYFRSFRNNQCRVGDVPDTEAAIKGIFKYRFVDQIGNSHDDTPR